MPFYMHELKARYQLLNDNLLDLSHLAFLHAGSIGMRANATEPEALTEDGPRILRSRRRMRNCPAPPVVRTTIGYQGLVDQVNGMDFYAPVYTRVSPICVIRRDTPRPARYCAMCRSFMP
jgi:vanillate O-demethylase monooxygenase subunit